MERRALPSCFVFEQQMKPNGLSHWFGYSSPQGLGQGGASAKESSRCSSTFGRSSSKSQHSHRVKAQDGYVCEKYACVLGAELLQ